MKLSDFSELIAAVAKEHPDATVLFDRDREDGGYSVVSGIWSEHCKKVWGSFYSSSEEEGVPCVVLF